MSLILKGIDLPEYGELRLIISKNGMIYGAEYPKVRHTYPFNLDAKAIQISKGHGDIIDRNDIYIGRWDIDTDLAEQLLNAPIILESERNNESDT